MQSRAETEVARASSAHDGKAEIPRTSVLTSLGAFSIYLLRRLGLTAASVVGGSFLVYAAMQIGSSRALSTLTRGKPRPAEEIAALEEQFRLNQPLFKGFVSWVGYAIQGDFGISTVYRQPVTEVVGQRAPVTIFLVCYTALIFLAVGLAFGIISAVRRGRTDSALTAISTVFVATPSFVAGVFLIWALAVKVPIFPGFGPGSGFLGMLHHTTLPAIALALGNIAIIARVVKISMRDQLRRNHVTAAVSQGLTRQQVVRRHVLRNALVPVTSIAGVNAGFLVVGSVVVDQVFTLNGLGMLLTRAVTGADMAVVQFLVLLFIVLFIVINTVVDICYAILDPRMRAWRK